MAENRKRGRPKGTGIDDARRLQDIARLIAAEPGIKPTTAIRSLGYSNPSVIRRLRDKLNVDLDMLLADARRDLGLVSPPTPVGEHKQVATIPMVRSPAGRSEPARASLLQLGREPRRTSPEPALSLIPRSEQQPSPARVDQHSARSAGPNLGSRTSPSAHQQPVCELSASASEQPAPDKPAAPHCAVPSPMVMPARPAAPHGEATLVEIGFQAAAVAMRQHLTLCTQVAHIPAVAAFIRQQMFLTEMMLGVSLPSPRSTSTRH